MLTVNRPFPDGSVALGVPNASTEPRVAEGASAPTSTPGCPCFLEGLTDRSCTNLCLLYQGVRVAPSGPPCRATGNEGRS
jgi:hypothetical protein